MASEEQRTCRNRQCRKNGSIKVPISLLEKRGDRWHCKENYCHKKEITKTANASPKTDIEGEVKVEQSSDNELYIEARSPKIKSLDDLIAATNPDLETYMVKDFKVGFHHQSAKLRQSDGCDKLVVTPLPTVRAWFIRRIAVATAFPTIRPVRCATPPRIEARPSATKPAQTIALIPDTQHGFMRQGDELVSFHDPSALAIAHQIVEETQPDRIVLLGDHLDLPDWSDKFLRSPDCQFLTQNAIDSLHRYLQRLRTAAPTAQIDWLEGNHEARMQKAVVANVTAAYNLKPANAPESHPVLSVPHLLGLDELGITYHSGYPYANVWLNDNIQCEHGIACSTNPGSSSNKNLKALNHSLIQGHIHNVELLWKTVEGRDGPNYKIAASPGTLARVETGFVPGAGRRSWQQGLLLIHLHDKHFYTEMVDIRQGTCLFRGRFLSVSEELANQFV